jgi:D-alanine-D-alanine ligase-like ATP-grasp enzyme
VVDYVLKKVSKYGKNFYSIDFIFDEKQNPWIVEMNSRPGITLEKEELEYRELFYGNFINFIKSVL